ncbi:MAG TPA: autotransporter assembly complex family protein [Pseudomonadales bacterium]
MADLMRLLLCLLLAACLVSLPCVAATPQYVVTGLDGELLDNVQTWLGTPRQGCELGSAAERLLLRRSHADAEKALQALGYYQPAIRQTLQRDGDCWQLLLQIDAGEPVRIHAVTLQIDGAAASDPPFVALVRQPGMAVGDVLRHDRYDALKQRLLRLLAERGYPARQLRRTALVVDVAQRQARVELSVDSGPRYRFGSIRFDQQSLSEDLLARFVPFAEGDPFDNQLLLSLRQSLSGSGYYADVRVQAGVPDDASLDIPVTVTATALPPHVYSAGLGFATDTGPRLRLGFENRRVNASGHRYSSELELSPVRSGLGFAYDIPLDDPERERLKISSAYLYQRADDHRSERYRLGLAHEKALYSGWIGTTSLDLEREYFTVASQRDHTDLLIPGYALSRTRADDRIYPRHGWLLQGKARLADTMLASTVSFVQLQGLAKWVVSIGQARFLLRLEGGATLADELTDLPASVRFFAGGDNSIRGYAYQSLGPVDDNGEVIGGRHLLAGSIELDFPLYGQWSAAVFSDAGNAYDTWDSFEPVSSVGAGVRWRSPIGPLRVDLAWPNDGPDQLRLHISMGMDL